MLDRPQTTAARNAIFATITAIRAYNFPYGPLCRPQNPAKKCQILTNDSKSFLSYLIFDSQYLLGRKSCSQPWQENPILDVGRFSAQRATHIAWVRFAKAFVMAKVAAKTVVTSGRSIDLAANGGRTRL